MAGIPAASERDRFFVAGVRSWGPYRHAIRTTAIVGEVCELVACTWREEGRNLESERLAPASVIGADRNLREIPGMTGITSVTCLHLSSVTELTR